MISLVPITTIVQPFWFNSSPSLLRSQVPGSLFKFNKKQGNHEVEGLHHEASAREDHTLIEAKLRCKMPQNKRETKELSQKQNETKKANTPIRASGARPG